MKFDLSKHIDQERFKRRCNELFEKQRIVELTEKTQRTLRQNAYLHVIIAYLAMETGNTVEYVKNEFFKKECNELLFVYREYDKLLKREATKLRSTRDLSKEEMTLAIDRFRNRASAEGYYLPSPDESAFICEIEMEVERYKQFI